MTLIRRTNNLFPSVFDEFFGRDWLGTASDLRSTTVPAVNIKETNQDFEVELSVPGLDKKDFEIQVDNDTLTIAYNKEEVNETGEQEKNYTRREFRSTSFKRSFTLPNTVKSDKIKAKYRDGILNLTIPKLEEKEIPSRLIEIS